MAKGHGGGEDRTKIKFRFYEVEVEGGSASVEHNISQLVQVFANRNNGAPARVPPPKQTRELAAPDAEDVEEPVEADEIIEPEDDDITVPARARAARAKAAYKPKLPNYLADLDLIATYISFKDFAESKKTKKHTVRYLIAAFWLKQNGHSPTVNIDKIYTCYSTVGWPMKISDWDLNLRQQIKTNRFRRMQTGEYAITPIGENDVKELNGTE